MNAEENLPPEVIEEVEQKVSAFREMVLKAAIKRWQAVRDRPASFRHRPTHAEASAKHREAVRLAEQGIGRTDICDRLGYKPGYLRYVIRNAIRDRVIVEIPDHLGEEEWYKQYSEKSEEAEKQFKTLWEKVVNADS